MDNSSTDFTKKRKLEEENGVVLSPEVVTACRLSSLDLHRVIEPFTHEQLSKIVLTASLRHPDVLDAVRSIADQDHTQRKLFIRGLGSDTTSEKLRAIFATYGDLVEASVVFDKVTGITKGYGFVNYKHIDGALLALKVPSKKIDGRMTVTSLSYAGLMNGNVVNPQTLIDVSLRKIVVRNVPCDMSEEKLLDHFSSYGEVEEGPFGFDLATGKSKGFALIVYRTVEAAKASVVNPIKSIDGHQVNCKLANSGYKTKNPCVALAAPQAQGSVGGGNPKPKPEVVNLNQQGSVQGSFASQFGENSGGLGFPGEPGSISGYGGGGQGQQLENSQHPMNLNSGSGLGLSSFGTNGGDPRLSMNGDQAPSFVGDGTGGGYGGGGQGPPLRHSQYPLNLDTGSGLSSFGSSNGGGPWFPMNGVQAPTGSHFGGPVASYDRTDGCGGPGMHFSDPGASYGGTSNGGGAGLGTSFGGPGTRYSGTDSGGGAGCGPGSGYVGTGSGGGAELGTGFSDSGASYVGTSIGDEAGLGIGFDPSKRSHYGLSPGSVKKNSGGYPKSAHYSLSSGSCSTDQTQPLHKKYLGTLYKK